MAALPSTDSETPAELVPPRRTWTWQCAALVVLTAAGIAVYRNSFEAPFVLDGIGNIEQNPAVRSLSLKQIFSGNRPVGYLSFALNYAWGGYRVWGYHAVNLAIHVAAAWLLFDLARRTLSRGRRAAQYAPHAWGLALLIALVWTVHPLQTQCVTYLFQRFESLMALFYLATLWCFVRATDSTSAMRTGWLVASVLCCALGMGTKEVTATAPLLVLWYDRVFAAASWRELFSRRGGYYAALAGTWCVLAAIMHGQAAEYSHAGVLAVQGVSALEYARSQPGVILHYLQLAFWPDQLCLDYGWPIASTPAAIVPQALAIGGLLAVTVWAMFRWPAWGFLGGSFFLILAPSSSIVPIVDLAFEHRMYLPLAAVVVMVVLLGFHVWQYLLSQYAGGEAGSSWLARAIPVVLLLAIAGALGWRTARRNEDYRSILSIWQVTARQRPEHYRVHSSLGKALLDRGDLAGGECGK